VNLALLSSDNENIWLELVEVEAETASKAYECAFFVIFCFGGFVFLKK
jgi:hypothetical protein